MIALLMIASILGCGGIVAWRGTNRLQGDAELINMAGRQRMLSQQIAMLTGRKCLVHEADVDAELTSALRLFVESQAELTSNRVMSRNLNPKLIGQLSREFKQIVLNANKALMADGGQRTEELPEVVYSHAKSFLPLMDTWVKCLETDSHRRLQQSLNLQVGISTASLLALVVTFFFVIIPAIRQTKQAIVEMAEADAGKTAFLANMSHEIRTPMTAILGFADYLFENGDVDQAPGDRVKAIQTIQDNGRHLLSVINGVLDLSKLESGKMEFEKVDCSPSEIVSGIEHGVSLKAKKQGIELVLDRESRLPRTIASDSTRLRQILLNVVANAIKFTKSGSVTIRGGELPGASGIWFEVKDTGIGMSEKQQARIFKPFSQADESTTRKFGGTGLGLSLSRSIAEELGGALTLVESAEGVGSTFRVEIPCEYPETVERVSLRYRATEGDVRPSQGLATLPNKPRVLLAEDGVDNQRLISHVLRKANAEVVLAENGAMAVELAINAVADDEPFDVILMDMQMPVMSGYDATSKLRSLSYSRPIIALTAHAMIGDRNACIEAGCDDYTTKPINRPELIELVAKYSIAVRELAGV